MLTNYDGTAITYDAIDNPLRWRNGANVEWSGRQMTLFSVTNGVVTSYVYNSDGIRTQKVHYDETAEYVGTTKYTLDGNKIVAENRLGTNIYYTYDDKGSIMGMIYGDETYMFSKNLQGDVIGIYNESRQLVAKYQYNAYGEITAITDASGNDISTNASHIANINPFRYRGYYYDTETGFYYLQTRYYDPVVGRFINADDVSAFAVEQGNLLQYNVFVYCLNEPISRVDENGMWSWKKVFWGGVAIAAAGLSILAAIPTGGASIAVGGVVVSAATATAAANAVVATGIAVAGVSVTAMASDGTPKSNKAQNKQFNDAMKHLKITDKGKIRRVHDAITGKGLTYWQIIEVAKKVLGLK